MATRTKPLISAAALASAAAVAVVSPGVAPSLNLPAPPALSKAAYQLTNISDVLSIPAVTWTDLLFGNTAWGGILGVENYGPDWAEPQAAFGQYGYVNPWAAFCDNGCDQSGIGGMTYLFFDALVNGNGEGFENSDEWKIGFVNYLFEPNAVFQLGSGSSPSLQYVNLGLSAAAWYALQGTVGRLVPSLSVPLASAFWGPNNVPVFYNFFLSIAAVTIGAVPLVGPVIGNSILAYLGDLSLEQGTLDTYQYGFSGALNYWVDLATGAVPWPTKVPWYKIDVAPESAATLAAATVETETAAESVANVTPAVEAVENTPAAEVVEGTPAAEAPESTPAAEVVESTPAAEVVESTPAVDVPASTPAVDAPAEPAVDLPAAEVAVDAPAAAPAAPKRPRPVRDAVENVGKQISAAIANAKAAKAERVEARKAKAGAASAE